MNDWINRVNNHKTAPQDHVWERIATNLDRSPNEYVSKKSSKTSWWNIAAGMLLVLGMSIWFINNNRQETSHQPMVEQFDLSTWSEECLCFSPAMYKKAAVKEGEGLLQVNPAYRNN